MASTHIASAGFDSYTQGTTSHKTFVNLTIPAATQVGDVMFIVYKGDQDVHGPLVIPSGWTLLSAMLGGGGSGPSVTIIWRKAVAGNAGSTLYLTSTAPAYASSPRAMIGVYRGGSGVSLANSGFVRENQWYSPGSQSLHYVPVGTSAVANQTILSLSSTRSNGSAMGISWTGGASTPTITNREPGGNATWHYVQLTAPTAGNPWPNTLQTSYPYAFIDWITYYTLRIDENTAPNSPPLVYPINNQLFDRALTQRFDWNFSDPDSGDSQSSYELRYRIAGAGTWAATLSGTTPNTYRDFAGNFFAAGSYEWQVRTTDAQGVWGPWSTSGFFQAVSAPAAPTITNPVGGQTISQNSHVVEWSIPGQTAYQVRTVADNGGVANTGVVYTDTGEMVSTETRAQLVSFATNNRVEHVQVRIKLNGLWSSWSTVLVNVSFTQPPIVSVAVAMEDNFGRAIVDLTNPAPAGGEPPVISNEVLRRAQGETQWAVINPEAPPNDTFYDYTVAKNVQYEYQAVALGDNGTSVQSAVFLSAPIELTGVWIHKLGREESVRHFRYNDNGGDETYERQMSLNAYDGRTFPIAEYGEGVEHFVDVDLAVEKDNGDYDALLALLKSREQLVYRDSYGRKLFFHAEGYKERRFNWGAKIFLRVRNTHSAQGDI